MYSIGVLGDVIMRDMIFSAVCARATAAKDCDAVAVTGDIVVEEFAVPSSSIDSPASSESRVMVPDFIVGKTASCNITRSNPVTTVVDYPVVVDTITSSSYVPANPMAAIVMDVVTINQNVGGSIKANSVLTVIVDCAVLDAKASSSIDAEPSVSVRFNYAVGNPGTPFLGGAERDANEVVVQSQAGRVQSSAGLI